MENKDEQVVQRNAFGELLAMATENVVAVDCAANVREGQSAR